MRRIHRQSRYKPNTKQSTLNFNTMDSLKTNWHKIQISLITAALKHIPNKKQKIQNFHYTYSSKATSLYNNLKTLG